LAELRADPHILDGMNGAVMLLDGELQVIYANGPAMALLDVGDGLGLWQRRLVARHRMTTASCRQRCVHPLAPDNGRRRTLPLFAGRSAVRFLSGRHGWLPRARMVRCRARRGW